MSVSFANLLDAQFIAGTATTAYQLFDFIRIKRITVRAMARVNNAGGNGFDCATVSVEFPGLSTGSFGGGKQIANSQLGSAEPVLVSIRPDPKSPLAQFQPTSGNTAFFIRAVDALGNALSGCVIDVDVVLRNSGDVNPAALGVARAGLTSGNIYFGGLDGQTDATTAARSAFIPRA